MGLDLAEVGAGAFRDKVREVLGSRPFAQILEARGVGIERVSEPKQTETTQRWKLGLRVQGVGVPLPTKMECSRRGLEDGVALGSVDPAVARAYRLPPFMASHYDATAALRQKLGVLAGQRETQARDVFDVHHYLTPVASRLFRARPGSREAVEGAAMGQIRSTPTGTSTRSRASSAPRG